jgi:hypothetical protein
MQLGPMLDGRHPGQHVVLAVIHQSASFAQRWRG